MPKLSLYRPEKSKDYMFMDRIILEQFQVGGVDVLIHKYIGPIDPSDPSKALGETSIQDVLFLENRDRKYDSSVYTIRGHYATQDLDFNLSQFGLFMQNDTIFLSVHINNSVNQVGRKIMSGDVIELPNLIDDYAANEFAKSLKRFYVVEDVSRSAEGFSATWYPHLYRLKLKPIVDSQEFKDILDRPVEDDTYAGEWFEGLTYYPGQVVKYRGTLYEVTAETTGNQPPNTDFFKLSVDNTVRDMMSTYNIEMAINAAVVAEAEAAAPTSGYDTAHYYTLALDDQGRPALTTVDTTYTDASQDTTFADQISPPPLRDGYTGYLLGDGLPPNQSISLYGQGIAFPEFSADGDFFLRTDYLPNRLFRFNGKRWLKYKDAVRQTMSNTDTRQTYRTSFVNNDNVTVVNGVEMPEQQSLSKALKPRADY